MRILIANHTAQISGGERAMLDLLTGIRGQVDAVAAAPRGPLLDMLEQMGVRAEVLPGTAGSLKLHPVHTSRAIAEILAAGVRLRALAHRHRSDLIHANSLRAGLSAVVAERLGGPPAIVHAHDRLPSGRASAAVLRVLSRAPMLLANSEWTKRGLPPGAAEKTRVVYNPLDLARFDADRIHRDQARAALGLDRLGTVLAVVGQITPWKGQDDAIRLVAALRARGVEVDLLLAGTPKFVSGATRYDNRAFQRELQRLVGALGLGSRVHFLGEIDQVEMVLAAIDVLLVPSWEEPLGRSMLEAMAMRVPVAATEVGGPAEVIVDGQSGLLLPPQDPEAWAEPVCRLLSSRRLRQEIGAAARDRVSPRFGIESHAAEVVAAYGEVVRCQPTSI